MSSKLMKQASSYRDWIREISQRFRQSQLKAAVSVNAEMLRFYWSLGRDMETQKANYAWGSHFYQQISEDLQDELPGVKSFSPRNLRYMHQFYRLFPEEAVAGGAVRTAPYEIVKQPVSQLTGDEFVQQPVSQSAAAEIFMIPWGHMVQILNKCGTDRERALFYVRKTIENNWSRAVLLNFLDTDLYERQGKAVTNFDLTLPAEKSDLAQAITKDP